MSAAAEIGKELTAAVEEADLRAIVARYADDAELVAPEGTFRGHGGIERFFRGWLDPFSSHEIVETRKLEADGVMMVESYASMTHTASLTLPSGVTVEPTGRRIRVDAMELYRVSGGLIVEHRFFYDRLGVLTQLGLA